MVLLLFNLKFLETIFIRETLLSSFELLLIGWKGAKWTSYKFLYLVSKLIDLCWSRLEILISNKSYQYECLFSIFIYNACVKKVYVPHVSHKTTTEMLFKSNNVLSCHIEEKRENDCEIKSAANTKILVLNNNKNLT